MKIRIKTTNRKVPESPYLTACKERDGILGNIELKEYTNVDDIISDKEFRVDPGSNLKRRNGYPTRLGQGVSKGPTVITMHDKDGALWNAIADELSKPGVFARLADILKRK